MAKEKDTTTPVTPPSDDGTQNTTPPADNTAGEVDTSKQKAEEKAPKFVEFACPYATVRIGDAYFDAVDGVVTIPASLKKEAEKMGFSLEK